MVGWGENREPLKKKYFVFLIKHIPYLLSNSVSKAVIKDLSANYIKAVGLNQAHILLKLRNNYYIVL